MNHLLENTSIREIGAPVAAGATIDNESDTIDMSGFDSATFIVPITDSVDTGVATVTAMEGDESDGSDAAALSGAVATATSGANDDLNDKLLVVEVSRPRKRYLTLHRASVTANIAYGNAIVILKKRNKKPVTADASVLQQTLSIGPVAA